MLITMVIVERNLELIGESIDNSGADAQTSEGAGAAEEGDLGEVGPVGVLLDEMVVDEGEDFLGHFVLSIPSKLVVIEPEDAAVGGGVEVEFHERCS